MRPALLHSGRGGAKQGASGVCFDVNDRKKLETLLQSLCRRARASRPTPAVLPTYLVISSTVSWKGNPNNINRQYSAFDYN